MVFDVEPGQEFTTCVGFQNRTGRTIRALVDVRDVGDSGEPAAPIDVSLDPLDFGAADWITLPTNEPLVLKHGDIVWLDIVVRVPEDALAGSNYAAIAMQEIKRSKVTGPGVATQVSGIITTQLFFDVPGSSGRSGKLDKVSSPKLIWWDGMNFARIDALERLRGLGIGPFKLTWRNTGDLSEELTGRIVLRSFTGKQVKELPVKGGIVLRGGSREFETVWTDPPIFGKFTPTLELTGKNGKTIKHEMQPIWVIPAWWYILLVIVAIAVPTVITLRRRRHMRQLEARLAAAESRAEGGVPADDEDSWSDGDSE